VRHETEFAEACPQRASEQGEESRNEDCLYLNVWRPAETTEDAPVMVWIHGGGNTTGNAGEVVPTSGDHLWYDGHVFAARHGIVVVTLNYRLGGLGFFAHPALEDEGSPRGNQGLFDQVRALQWVQDNIAAFGGDPDNVTIFGESAGSADVCLHVASPLSRGLFHRAVSQSGGCTMRPRGDDQDETDAAYVQYAEDLGCSGDDVLDCLRGKEVGELIDLEASMRGMGDLRGDIFGISIDGEFLPRPAREIYDAGDIAQVPYILGSNTEEGMLYFYTATVPEDDAGYEAELQERFGDFAERILEVYPSSRFEGNYRAALARVVGDSGLVCGTHDTARRAVAAGLDVWMYNFNVPWSIARTILGPTHASEISHVFGTPYNEDEDGEAVAEAMNAYWARFAETGDPNGDDAPAEWPQFSPDENDDDLRLQLDPDFDVLESFRKEECALWRDYHQAG
jgi:para-nitrobenzyl esterase